MSLNHLICPCCKCPLTPPAQASTGVSCPRCMTWVEIDPSCASSCITCHKMQEAAPRPCAEVAEEVSVPIVVRKKRA